jgi:predicted ABC-class ATPase
LLLFDEDLCATNFMVRDEVMRELVPSEPITPLVEKVILQHIDADRRLEDYIVIKESPPFSLLAVGRIT